MAALVKATLADAADPEGTAIPVQLNPTSLRFQMTNSVDAGQGRGRQVQQYQATGSTTLTMDLVFDTADEGATGSPRSVREKTRQISRFVLPSSASGSKQSPPRVKFTWGSFVLEGVMTSLTEDIDLFSAEGVPLRAKVSISISEQDPDFANLASGAGANKGAKATEPGGAGSGPGSKGAGFPDRTALALGGESAAEFSARVGLDPAAWRSVTGGLEGSLSLDAGAQIDFSADVAVSGGIGASVGIEAGGSASLDAALGLDVAGAAPARAGAPGQAGFALAAAGGLAAASATTTTARSDRAAADARQAFGGPSPVRTSATSPTAATAGVVRTAAPPAGAGRTVAGPGSPFGRLARTVTVAARPAAVDARASSFGFGVPLRPQVHGAAEERAASLAGTVRRVGARPAASLGPTTNDPTVPPWVALPARDAGRRAGDRVQAERRPGTCGCGRGRPAAAPCGTCGGR